MGQFNDIIARLFGKGGQRPTPLPRSAVEHDSVDKFRFESFADDSPRFKRIAIEDAPLIAPDVADPDAIDFTAATAEEIKEWQEKARAAKRARDNAPPYDAWADLTRDVFYSYHHPSVPEVKDPSEVDPAVAHHAKIMRTTTLHEEHQKARNITRDDATTSAVATMAYVGKLREILQDEMLDQARQSEEFEQARDRADSAISELESMREQAKDLHENGQPIPQELVDDIKQAVHDKRAGMIAAAEVAQKSPLPMSKAAADAIAQAVEAAHEAAQSAGNIPSFGQGFGGGEPRYESPEQALSIADMWSNDPTLNAVSQLYGRLDADFRYQRATRVVGGAEEIVDLKFGDELRRVLPAELTSLADDETEDDFYSKFLSKELRVYDTVGDENQGKGPVVLCCDESGTMNGERNVWAKALALVLLNICRRENRDFAYVGWASADQVTVHLFKAKEPMDAQAVVDMVSHFYGGGTVPLGGLTAAVRIMDEREFRKADILMLTDGQATFDTEDKLFRDKLESRGVRFHGIGIPKVYGYLNKLCGDNAVALSSFDLDNPSEATAHLATHIT